MEGISNVDAVYIFIGCLILGDKVLSQIAAGKLFGGEDLYLQPLNSYITEAIDRLQDIWSNSEYIYKH